MKFGIGINQGRVNIVLDENLPETDILEMLTFDDSHVENLLRTHSANQSYWEALTVRLKTRYERFKEEWQRKWWAHNKTYSRMVLAAYGDLKPTGDTIKDAVVQVYSSDVTDNERAKYAKAAYSVANEKGRFKGSEDEFWNSMYKYLRFDPPWYFETVVAMLKQLQEEFETVETVAERLNSQSFHLDLYAKMQMARRYNIDGVGLSDGQVMQNINQGRGGQK